MMTQDEAIALMAPTGLDQTISRYFPKWGAARLRARREFAYEAARSTRLRKVNTQLQGPEDYTAMQDRIALIRQMRDLTQNFGLFQGIQDKIDLYAFGTLKYQAHTGDEDTDEIYESYLESCFSASGCDLSGRHNFRYMISLANKSSLCDGDYALKWQRNEDGLKLVGIESDRIGGQCSGIADNNYYQGFTVDPRTGRPLTARVFNRTKANSYENPVEVPVSDLLFFYEPRRYDQYRGITPFAPVINEARDLKEVLEACLIGTKFENMHAAVGYTESGQPLQDPSEMITSTELGANSNPIKEQALKAGMLQWAPTGSKVDFMKSERPSGNFQTYVDMLVRLIGTAMNLPYGFIYQLLGTGPAVRAELQQAQRVIQGRQTNMRERVMDPAKNTWLMDGIASGAIPYTANWFRGSWQFPPWVTIDAGRDSRAMIDELNAGVRTKASIFAENGEDQDEQSDVRVEEVKETIENAQEIAKETGVEFETVLTMLEVRTPNGFLFKTGPAASEAQAQDNPGRNEVMPAKSKESKDKEMMMSAKERLYESILNERIRESRLTEMTQRRLS